MVLAVAIYRPLRADASPAPGAAVYVVTAVMALYLNVFVLIVQSFQKVPALKALAPTQSEPPFAIAQARRAGRLHRPRIPRGQAIPAQPAVVA